MSKYVDVDVWTMPNCYGQAFGQELDDGTKSEQLSQVSYKAIDMAVKTTFVLGIGLRGQLLQLL
jgi:hypothetical protein